MTGLFNLPIPLLFAFGIGVSTIKKICMTISLSYPFILASASPRRQELLRSVGLKFKTVPAHVNENYLAGESPRQHVKRLSSDKTMVIAGKYPESWVLGADTIVVIDGLILGKPKNKTKAREMLQNLSGREHKFLPVLLLLMWPLKFTKRKSFNQPCDLKRSAPKRWIGMFLVMNRTTRLVDTLYREKAPISSNQFAALIQT